MPGKTIPVASPPPKTEITAPISDISSGRLIIVSGPSGAGKSTVVNSLLSRCELPLKLSVSATTRSPRPGEVDGVHYQFLSPETFSKLREQHEFLECKEVFGRGVWYGTLRNQVATGLKAGQWVILEIDVQGAMTLLERGDLNPITLFIHPGGAEQLELRLRGRGTETESSIRRRLEVASGEMQLMHRYQYEIINGDVDSAVAEICQILNDQSKCSKN